MVIKCHGFSSPHDTGTVYLLYFFFFLVKTRPCGVGQFCGRGQKRGVITIISNRWTHIVAGPRGRVFMQAIAFFLSASSERCELLQYSQSVGCFRTIEK